MSEVYRFKAMSEVEVLEAPAENTTVLVVEDGAVRQVPAGKLGGGTGGVGGFLVNVFLDPASASISGADKTFAEIAEAVEAGAHPVARMDMSAMEQGYLYCAMAQFMPGQGAVFGMSFAGGTGGIICTEDDTWVLQEE